MQVINNTYTYVYCVTLRDTDAAGVLYFSSLFEIFHLAYENFMSENGLPLSQIIENKEFALPIVHSEADFIRSIRLGDELFVKMKCSKLSTSSFSITYEIILNNVSVAKGLTIHVSINPKDGKSIKLPERAITLLNRII